MALSSVGHKVIVSDVPVTVDVPARINIKKRRETLVYRSVTDNDNINITFLAGEDSSADTNLSISDRSTSLVQNRIPTSTDITTITGSTFTLNVDQFLVTEQFTEETPTQPSVPLFYVHTLSAFVAGTTTLVSVEFMDYEFNVIQLSEYVLDSSTGQLYNNIENSYDEDTQEVDITFVKYTLKTTTGGVSTIDAYHELISNDPIFVLADFDDIDAFGVLIPTTDTYLLTESSGLFNITMSRSGTYAYKELPESRIKLLPPASPDITNPWYLRVTNGKFLTSLLRTKNIYWDYEYSIAEFNSQTFEPFPPYKAQTEETGIRIAKRIVQTAKNIAYSEDNNLYVTVQVLDRADSPKYAMTNDSSQVGLKVGTTSIYYTADVLSLDASNGIIEVNQDILEDDKIYVSYYTEEKQFEFTNVDCNPTNNLDILNQRIVVYVSPADAISGELDKSLYYLIVDPLGVIQYCSQAEDNATGTDPATQKLLSEDFTTAGIPTHTMYYDTVSSSGSLNSTPSGIQADVNGFSFIDKYTVESQLFTIAGVLTSGNALDNLATNGHFLVVGDVYVGESQRTTAFEDFDVRVQGGGIKEDSINDAIVEQSEIAWYWDQIQQRPYPAATSFCVEVPQTLLTDFGGRFTRETIQSATERHMQLGGYGVLKTYAIDPTISGVVTTSGAVVVSWPSYGAGTTYNVYSATILEGPYYQQNTTALSDASVGNFYAMSGLNPNTPYYLFVEGVNSDGWSYGQTIQATTASYVG